MAIKRNVTQVILEGRDDDLELIFSCHPHIQEAFTMMELAEPDAGQLQAMVQFGAERLTGDHGIRIDTEAVAAAIELTNNYRADSAGMDRAQPERSVTLLDRALASYRLEAHEKPPHLAQLQARVAAAKGDEAKALTDQIARATQEWEQAQGQLRAANRRQREGEEDLARIDWEIADLGKREGEQRTAVPERSFNLMASKGGFKSGEMQELETKREAVSKIVEEAKAAFASNAKAINDQLELTRDIVLKEFSTISGISVSKLNEDEREKLRKLEGELKKRIFGQDHVDPKLANAVKAARRRPAQPGPAAGLFMFLGPSGVGKTEIAKALAKPARRREGAARFDMSRIHGEARGRAADRRAAGLRRVRGRRHPHEQDAQEPTARALFDEIEKAHPDVFNVFLQILSDGRLTDNIGRTVSFRESIIIMTTNLGQPHFLDPKLSPTEQ